MSVEALQKRIKTTQELRDIVNNMKTLSSVSIWQYEQANKALDKYRRNLRNAFHALMLNNGVPKVAQKNKTPQKYLYILIGTDNGMVGKFNKEIIEKVRSDMRAKKIARKDTLFFVVGRRLASLVEHSGLPIYDSIGIFNSVKVVSSLAEKVLLAIDRATLKERVDYVAVCYHRRQSNITVVLENKQIIPYDRSIWKNMYDKPWETNNFPQVSGDKRRMFTALINEALMISMVRFLNDSLASEHFTRMTNMQEAEKNIDENLERMNLEYQQQRQENITDELIDVISGADAMRKK